MAATSDEMLKQLEQETDLARLSLSGTLAQVRHRLEAERLKQDADRIRQEVMDRARQSGSRVIQERRRQLKARVVEAAMNNPAPTLALGTLVAWSIWRRVSQIPPPILLVCAGGIAGLMRWNDGSRQSDRQAYSDWHAGGLPEPLAARQGDRLADPGRYDEAGLEPHLAGNRWDAAAETGPREAQTDAAARAREVAYETGTRVSEAAARAGSAVSEATGRTAAEISRAANDAAAAAGDLGRQARSQLSDLLNRHPLVLGGIGLAVCAAIATSLRPSETEARLVGETSDRFKRRARELFEAQFERAQTIAERAYEAGWNEVREQGLSADAMRERVAELGDKVSAVAQSATHAAKERATS